MPRGKYSKKAQSRISEKMSYMKGEDKPQKQKVAIAMDTARHAGLKVPKRKRKKKRSIADKAKSTAY